MGQNDMFNSKHMTSGHQLSV